MTQTTLNKEELIALAEKQGLTISYVGDILMDYYGEFIVVTDLLTKFATLIESKLSDAKPVEQSDVSERDKFEATYTAVDLSKNQDDEYNNILIDAMWRGWQASAKVNREVSEWISCADRLPEEWQKVLVYRPKNGMAVGNWFERKDGDKFWTVGGTTASGKLIEYPTYWMTQPTPPESE